MRHRQGAPLGFFGPPWGPTGVIPEELEEAADAKDKKKADGKGFTSRPTEGVGSDVIFRKSVEVFAECTRETNVVFAEVKRYFSFSAFLELFDGPTV